MSTYTLKIVTPNEVVFEGPVEHVLLPAAEGYMGILASHAPFVSPVTSGKLEYREPGDKTTTLKVTGGFVEVRKDRVLVLTDTVEKNTH